MFRCRGCSRLRYRFPWRFFGRLRAQQGFSDERRRPVSALWDAISVGGIVGPPLLKPHHIPRERHGAGERFGLLLIDPAAIQQFGLVAEDLGKVNPDLVVRDSDGKAYTVRYRANHAMLLNEFLNEYRTVQELKNEIATLTATVKEQASQMQKVGARLEVNESRSRTVLSDQ